MSIQHKQKVFIYGTQYYRIPNPPREQHPYHLKRIKDELGFNTVKLFLQWNTQNTAPGKYDFEEMEEIFDICNREGLNVFVNTNLETCPYWLERQSPEARYVSANGQAIELGPNGQAQSGGYPGLCFHNDIVREAAKKYLIKLVETIKDNQSLIGYDCWNEPHLEPAWMDNLWGNMGDRLYCYCNASRVEFRKWLAAKYNNIGILNSTWARSYGDWEDINPPNRHGHYADWLDWIRFWFDSLSEYLRFRYETIKKEDPEKFVMSHSGAVPPFLPRPNAFINNWSLAEPVDIWGTSFAPKYFNWDMSMCAGVIDATRSAARGKEIWISEMTGGGACMGGFKKSPVTRPKDIMTWNWLSVAYGVKAIIYWCYLEESTGLEAGSFGLIRYNGKNTERAQEAARQANLINKNFHIFKEYTPKADVAILYDPDNSSLLFAMENKDDRYSQSHTGYYKAVWGNDLYAKYITYSSLEDLKEKILIVPMCLTLPQNVADHIKNYVKKGGILITDARMGLFDESGFLKPDLPSCGLTDIAGLREDEAFYSDPGNRPEFNNPGNLSWPDEIYGGPEISITYPIKTSFRVHGYLAPLLLKDAECIGKWKDICLAAHNNYGKGEVYYFGTYLGLALSQGEKGAFSLLSAILNRYVNPAVRGNMLRPRLIEGNNESLLVVFNVDKLKEFSETITLPGEYINVYDVINNGKKIVIEENKVELSVEPEGVRVLRLIR